MNILATSYLNLLLVLFSKLISDNDFSNSDFEKIISEISKYNDKKQKILFTPDDVNTALFENPTEKLTDNPGIIGINVDPVPEEL